MGRCPGPPPPPPALTVNAITRRYGHLLQGVSPDQWAVVRALSRCRTPALGGRKLVCQTCGEAVYLYNSCRNRHCPQCQGAARAQWVQARLQDLLPVPYFHLVFTLPAELRPLALRNKAVVYDLLFHAVAETVLEVAARRLGATVGLLAVLHTWGQQLLDHPHLHCLVTGGGLGPGEARWQAGRADYFLPVRILSAVFRGKFLHALAAAYEQQQLEFSGKCEAVATRARFQELLRQAAGPAWVVYSKKPFGGAEQVVRYLGRYTHRVAIANQRLLALADDRVTFAYRDYAEAGRTRTLQLHATEFLRRFLLHVLPPGFKRIRGYGLLGNRVKRRKLALCRERLAAQGAAMATEVLRGPAVVVQDCRPRCAACGSEALRLLATLPPHRRFVPDVGLTDTS